MKKILLSAGLIASINATAVLGPIPIYLQPKTLDSNNFIGSETSSTFATEIYTKEDIKTTNSANIYDFLNQNTSINFAPSAGNKFSQKIAMRGYGLTDGYQHIVIIIDGRRINNIDTAISSLSGIAIDSIDKIEIIKGSGSVVYGDSATAGVIKITTKNINNIKLKLGNYGYKHSILSLAENKEKLKVSALFNKTSSSGYSDDTDANGNTDTGEQSNQNFNFNYAVNQDFNFGISLEKNNIDNYYNSYLSLNDFNNNPSKVGATGFQKNEVNSDIIKLDTNYKFTNNFDINFNVSNENKDITTFSTNNYLYQSRDLKLNYKKDNLQTTLGYSIFKGNRTTLPTAFNPNSTDKNNKGFFINSIYTNNDNTYNIGFRKEKIEYTYQPTTNHTTPKNGKHNLNAFDIGWNKKINNNLTFFTNFNKSFQAPLIDRFFDFNGNFNGFINPTKVKTFNIGINYLDEKNKIKLTVFRANIEDEMYLHSATFNNTNLDKTHKQGIELQYRRQFNNNWKTNINYSYIDAVIDKEDRENGAYNDKDLPMSSKHNITASILYNINDNSNVVITQKYRSKSFAEEDFANNFLQKQKAFNSTDLKYNYQYNKDLKFSLNIENIFKKKYGLWLRDDVVYPASFTRNINIGLTHNF